MPATGQNQMGQKKDSGSEINMSSGLPTVIKCPQPKTLDKFTIIQNLQPQYQFRDYFIATCQQGYQLVEVRA